MWDHRQSLTRFQWCQTKPREKVGVVSCSSSGCMVSYMHDKCTNKIEFLFVNNTVEKTDISYYDFSEYFN